MDALRLRRLGGESGQSSLEFAALLPYLLLAAAFAWQVLLLAASVNAAENAARTGSRAATLGRDGAEVALEALPTWLQDDSEAEVGPDPGCDDDPRGGGTRVVVCTTVPLLWPGLGLPGFSFTRTAVLPPV
jgi:hypothetical protein